MPHRRTAQRREVRPLTALQYERQIARAARDQQFELRLYVAGTGPLSTQAIENINQLCRLHLEGRYRLDVIDIHQQPQAMVDAQLIAAPTLVKVLPPPMRKFIGNLGCHDRIVRGLNLIAMHPKPAVG